MNIATQPQIDGFINKFNDWSIVNGKLQREFVFADFAQAFSFMTDVALEAERANHHPEWFNVYKKVRVDLTTHEAGGITERDFQLAQQMERIAATKQS
ncbi:MAG: 4a-hydroxytetrahydrobiopterin dehydratase [Cycloclasticus sp.]|nr:4a-hydroxytetrahydrobiopterin dehydratase [Cycloclasticus sp.]MBQ0789957.1 4a-hydroxytetrahydrobiopterin dehydratase [Cycloclasticus sp.]